MLSRAIPRQLTVANRWLNRQLWQHESPAPFFDPLVERVHPLWVRGQARAQVVNVHSDTPDTRTFTLEPNSRWKGFKAGQHVNLTAEIDGVRQTRTFSLSSSPEQLSRDGLITFTIKRLDEGRVTPWLHTRLSTGDVVELSQAFGDFTLPEGQKPLFYLAGGSGITPILSHLQSLAAQHDARPIGLVYLVRNRGQVIAADLLSGLPMSLPGLKVRIIHTRERPKDSKLSMADIQAVANDLPQAASYLCGPRGLIDQALPLLASSGAPDHSIRQALFTLPTSTALESGAGSLVRKADGRVVEGDGKATLLEMAEQAGLNPAHGCRQGICRQCTCKKTSGVVMNRLTGRLSGSGEETIQPCISLPQGPVTVEL